MKLNRIVLPMLVLRRIDVLLEPTRMPCLNVRSSSTLPISRTKHHC